MKKIAVISDIHGCYEELEELYNALSYLSLDEIWSVGDVVDRGPSSGRCISFLMDKNIKAVLGNHEHNIYPLYERYLKDGFLPKSQDKKRTILDLTPNHLDWMRSLPTLHIDDELKLIVVHGGLWPKIPIHKQPPNVIRAQLIKPDEPGVGRWWGIDIQGRTEEENRKEGFERWYRLYDYDYDVIYGHSTWSQPMIYQREGYGKCIGIDTGSSFGGCLTACVYTDTNNFFFISIKNKKVYVESTTRVFWED